MTRAEIEADPWFGNQRAQVIALLDRAEAAEAELKRVRGIIKTINEWCEPVGTGTGGDGDALNTVCGLYELTEKELAV